jgi:hypothetical protein
MFALGSVDWIFLIFFAIAYTKIIPSHTGLKQDSHPGSRIRTENC